MSKKLSIILIAIFSVFAAIWIWSFAAPKDYVILGGSTSVNTFMQRFTKTYHDDKDTDFIYNSTGSQAGVSGVEKEMYAGGFISKDISSSTLSDGNEFAVLDNNPEFDENVVNENDKYEIEFEKENSQNFVNYMNLFKDENKQNAKRKSYFAFEFAIDAIVLIYNPPTWFNNDLMNLKLKEEDKTTGKELALIYAASNSTWENLARMLGQEDVPNSSSRISTFTRESGSGTRSAFSDLTGIKEMPSSSVVNSNGSMFENIKSSRGTFGFVSYAFVKQVTKESGVKIAGVSDKKLGNPADEDLFENPADWEHALKWNGSEWVPDKTLTNDDFIKDKNGYELKRPFIGIFNSHNSDFVNIVEFFAYMMKSATKSENDFVDEGLVPVFKLLSNEGVLE
ncbi:phosphate transport system substrate-binding protein [Spiroplasma chinense]|uniref:Phosphate transport system substrate-binding protein n=1 Tax=Spiroplasma chinense TaxID=216932 RepID=A0A5B9Y4S4_9MOLU|nr:phosphate ABC transporter substrate-binding protein [Spiroplasma chinense]QEH62168.1 phosphate transport system substrate-binding protein [Spiroplasma chinense]